MKRMPNLTLRSKLMLAFVGVILFTAAVSIVATGSITKKSFKKYALAADTEQARALAPLLERYYRRASGWTEVESALITDAATLDTMALQMGTGSAMARMMGSETTPMLMWMPPAARVVVVDTDGLIVADTEQLLAGDSYPVSRLQAGIDIDSDGEIVGLSLCRFHDRYLAQSSGV